MASNNELLWTYLIKKQYADALTLIQANPSDLDLNEIHPKVDRTYLMHLLSAPKQEDPQFLPLVRAIIGSPSFSMGLHIHSKIKENAFTMAIRLNNPAVIDILLAYPEKFDAVFADTKLQYAIAQQCLKYYQLLLSRPADSESAQLNINNLNAIMPKIRDIAIRHAIATDDPELMQALEDAGAEPVYPLSNYNSPITLAQSAPRVRAWFQQLSAKSIAALSGINTNVATFARVLADQNAAKLAYEQGRGNIYEQGVKRLDDVTRRMTPA